MASPSPCEPSLIDLRSQVRALLHDYLTDDQSGTVSSRNPIVSVNEVLRLARPRDQSKVRANSSILPSPARPLTSDVSPVRSKSSSSPIPTSKRRPRLSKCTKTS
jgi:hypothetical protein